MIVICSFLSLSGYLTWATEVTQSHSNRLKAHYYWKETSTNREIVQYKLLWWLHLLYEFLLKRLAYESHFCVHTVFCSICASQSEHCIKHSWNAIVQHVFKCALISLGNVCCCVCVLFVKNVVLLSQIFTNSATVAVLL